MSQPSNATPINPTQVAREALRTLASRRVPPTPDNYRKIYGEIAGPESTVPDSDDKALLAAIAALPANHPLKSIVHKGVSDAVKQRDWGHARQVLSAVVTHLEKDAHSPVRTLPASWKVELTNLLHAWDVEHAGWTRARKRKSVEDALETASSDPEKVFLRLRNAMNRWKESGQKEINNLAPEHAPNPDATVPITAGADESTPRNSPDEHRDLIDYRSHVCACLATTLSEAFPAVLAHAPDLAAQARILAAQVRKAAKGETSASLITELDVFSERVAATVPGNDDLRDSLLALLRLLVDNMHELLANDRWLRGQFDVVREVLGKPLSPATIADANNAMRALMARQIELRETVETARNDLKALVHTFLDRLELLVDSTDSYHDKLERYSRRIEHADDVGSLTSLLRDLIADTRAMQSRTAAVRVELSAAHERVEHAELRIQQMEQELATMSERNREDALTGVMNRRGLEEAFSASAASADDSGRRLCLALVDIDNFKALNDRLGHLAGDAALRHLVSVVKDNLRPQDRIARYGGEEFVVLLPETDAQSAVEVMIHLQRRLTKHFFLYKQERALITFSCGTASRLPGESLEAVLERADKAMYAAKHSGKNRVISAEVLASGSIPDAGPAPELAS